jgi:putative RNA 2'-phosphotransferase
MVGRSSRDCSRSERNISAKKVGSRRGRPIILTINSEAMDQAGYEFYLSANDVWLTDAVPTQFINFHDNE